MTKKCIIYTVVILFSVIAGPISTAQNNPKSTLKSQLISLASFKHKDIGNPSIAGTVKIVKNGFDISAGGADIWGVKDEFNYIFVERTGDFDVLARVESLMAANLYTKAGIMARENLNPGCRHIYFQVFSDNNPRNKNNGGYEFQYRQERDSSMKAIYPKSYQGPPEFPVSYPNTWIRLQRVNNDFTGYYSTDGKNWKPYTTFTLKLQPVIYVGLAVTAHNTGHNASAKFRDISEFKH
jgi:hypothetical protein